MTLTVEKPAVGDQPGVTVLFPEANARRRRIRLTAFGSVGLLVLVAAVAIFVIRPSANPPAPRVVHPEPSALTTADGLRSEVVVETTINYPTGKPASWTISRNVLATTLVGAHPRAFEEDFSSSGNAASTPETDNFNLLVETDGGRTTGYHPKTAAGVPCSYPELLARGLDHACPTDEWVAGAAASVGPILGHSPVGANFDPAVVREGLRLEALGTATLVGRTTLNGVPMNEYREQINLEKWAVQTLHGGGRSDLSNLFLGPNTPEVNYWIDHRGRLRQVQSAGSPFEVVTLTFGSFNAGVHFS